jgi:hypothetical protein
MPEAPDRNIRAVLQRAASDPAFHMLLLNNREAALKDFPLSDAERNMLMSATATQIRKMVEQARQRKWYETPVSRRTAAIAAATGALTVGGLVLAAPTVRGIRPERRAGQYLEMIAKAQSIYREQYGRYGNLEELTGGEKPALHPDVVRMDDRFVFEVSLDGNSFNATARMKNTERAWQVGPDGQVKPLE